MSLSARSIALRGFGYGALAVALSGYVAVREPVQPPVVPVVRSFGGGLPAYNPHSPAVASGDEEFALLIAAGIL